MASKSLNKVTLALNAGYALVVTLFLATTCIAQTNVQNIAFTPLETIITDLNADNLPDTLQIYLPPVEGDPGQFRKINISLGGHGRNTFTANDSWDKIDRSFTAGNTNAVTSNRVFVHKEGNKSIILLWGFAYGSGREEYAIIQVTGNKMEFLHHYWLEDPVTFTDLDADGHAELLCRQEPEMDTKTTVVYSPYMVYTFNGVFTLSQALTKKYNTDHYVWAGYKYNEKIIVESPSDGAKPRIIKQ